MSSVDLCRNDTRRTELLLVTADIHSKLSTTRGAPLTDTTATHIAEYNFSKCAAVWSITEYSRRLKQAGNVVCKVQYLTDFQHNNVGLS